MPDRRVSEVAASAAEKTQAVKRKGPTQVGGATFLPIEHRRAIGRAFHRERRSVQQLAITNGIGRLVVEDAVRIRLNALESDLDAALSRVRTLESIVRAGNVSMLRRAA